MAREEKSPEKTILIRFRPDLARKLRLISTERGVDLPTLTEQMFKDIIEREYRVFVKRVCKDDKASD